ncbi:hypothetical protein JCM3766R1_002472 [Sporobolomyces carnicolor]
MTNASTLDKLEQIRTSRVRQPREVFNLGRTLVENGWINQSHPQRWTVMEQLANASIECGQFQLASVLIDRIGREFPPESSPRTVALQGALLEAKGQVVEASRLYEQSLVDRETNVVIRKRLIALHLSTPLSVSVSKASHPLSRQRGIDLLVEYLDTTYVDPEAWQLLARSYAELGLHAQALSSLDHAVLLQPHNPSALVLHAELLTTMARYDVALKEFLRVIELGTELDQTTAKDKRRLSGAGTRAAFGVKLCISRLRSSPPTSSSTVKLDQLEVLMTRLILDKYGTKREGAAELNAVREWLSSSSQ